MISTASSVSQACSIVKVVRERHLSVIWAQQRASLDPQENVLMAMVRWVEEGVAPEMVRGTKFVNDTVGMGVDFKRAHCKYPARNIFVGGAGGNWKDWTQWKCI